MQARAEHLADHGLARRDGRRISCSATCQHLRRRELDAIGASFRRKQDCRT